MKAVASCKDLVLDYLEKDARHNIYLRVLDTEIEHLHSTIELLTK